MALKISTQPATEPLSLVEAKLHLRVDSGSFADNLTSVQSIVPGAHIVAASYSLIGTAADVLGYSTVVLLESGTNGSNGTVDVKLQESDDNVTFTDVASGAFTQVTTANDNATYEKAYTGVKHHLRVVCTVAVIACEFGVSIVKSAPTSAEDTLITSLIKAARSYCEKFQNRAYITQTWELWLDEFPSLGYLMIPLPPLISIGSIKYYDVGDNEFDFANTNYYVDTKNEPGWVVLNSTSNWPSTTLRPANGVCVTFTCGYGVASDVPCDTIAAIKLLLGHLYEHREAVTIGTVNELPLAVKSLLWMDRVF